jgi:Tripartite tricarboxylate transporter family receptor
VSVHRGRWLQARRVPAITRHPSPFTYLRLAASPKLPDAFGTFDRRPSAWGPDRSDRAPGRAMAVGAARPAPRDREPSWRRHPHCHRSGRASGPRRLYATPDQRVSRNRRLALRQPQFHFIRDVAPVAGVSREPNVMEVHPSVPVKTVSEFIAYAKANPGKLNMPSGGTGAHLIYLVSYSR